MDPTTPPLPPPLPVMTITLLTSILAWTCDRVGQSVLQFGCPLDFSEALTFQVSRFPARPPAVARQGPGGIFVQQPELLVRLVLTLAGRCLAFNPRTLNFTRRLFLHETWNSQRFIANLSPVIYRHPSHQGPSDFPVRPNPWPQARASKNQATQITPRNSNRKLALQV